MPSHGMEVRTRCPFFTMFARSRIKGMMAEGWVGFLVCVERLLSCWFAVRGL